MVGLGKTGLSCARYLARHSNNGEILAVTDSRPNPPGLDALRDELPELKIAVGGFDPALFAAATRLIVSPGVPISEPLIQQALARGATVLGDVELFIQIATAPICAITGSNGKSTVTTLVGLMVEAVGLRVAVGGNLGEPVLELLAPDVDLYVLELSSFQLETTPSLCAEAAVVLNIAADHLDRYPDLAAYAATKAQIYRNARVAVVNRDDAAVVAMREIPPRPPFPKGGEEKPPLEKGGLGGFEIGFTLNAPAASDFGLRTLDGATWLCRGELALVPASEVRIPGRHNLANTLAALALLTACAPAADLAPAVDMLRQFPGLPHRSELVAEFNNVRWFNDSKGTNPGATIAALEGLVTPESAARVVLIAGGDGKGAEFAPLVPAVAQAARAVVLIGRDAPLIARELAADPSTQAIPRVTAIDMADAVKQAAQLAQAGDCVLLSPACASFDMFNDYTHRGRVFIEKVRELVQSG
ncbi:UDP-N-acetylmuramoyl-L-alanine--D-glutamate ligase [Chromatium okenii]|uniref:UDP-N-acetylmuramoyl-L-alanine--D-glutamate ligase n=1 Tax=Chromatium okenii TaxID=61644 RepID=UPI0026F12A6A|nr:UDP-N-acetylmuramoyl-L-alanine--D-glutamate ligase [Chromatium okenii]MBV5309391.1 UDP-N-acetylmuramoyl-L-alanine--D-glutamate ligase [Chromatium okenii]